MCGSNVCFSHGSMRNSTHTLDFAYAVGSLPTEHGIQEEV